MPIKKTSTAKAQAKTVSKPKPAAKPAAKPTVSNEALKVEIAELKKQIESLSHQCQCCCADLQELKSQKSSEKDNRIDALINAVKARNNKDYSRFRQFIKTHF